MKGSIDITIKPASLEDLDAMVRVGDNLFDHPVKPDRAREFLQDPRHHLILAWQQQEVVGMASAFHYVHPDKDPIMFINEVGVVDAFQNKGVGRRLVTAICDHARGLGCREAWVATDSENLAARKTYVAAGGKEYALPITMINFDLAGEQA